MKLGGKDPAFLHASRSGGLAHSQKVVVVLEVGISESTGPPPERRDILTTPLNRPRGRTNVPHCPTSYYPPFSSPEEYTAVDHDVKLILCAASAVDVSGVLQKSATKLPIHTDTHRVKGDKEDMVVLAS